MSEKQNCGIRDFSKYDEMTTEALEEILRLDAEMTEGQESDTEKLLYIMEVLTERRKKNDRTGNTAQEAYELFTQHYMPETENTNPVSVKKNQPKNRQLRLVRSLAATAAVLVILIAGSVTARAFGIDVWKAVIQWTQETFHFGEWGNANPNNNLSFKSLQEALVNHKVTTPLAPTWFPDGYKFAEITIDQSPLQKTYRAQYTDGEQELIITLREYLDGEPLYVEQSDGLIEKYEVEGITYYLFSDINVVKAVWINGSYECNIMGNVTIDDLKKMIDSIEKG